MSVCLSVLKGEWKEEEEECRYTYKCTKWQLRDKILTFDSNQSGGAILAIIGERNCAWYAVSSHIIS